MDISGILGDLYELADRAPVTELPVHADMPVAVPDETVMTPQRAAEIEAARLRAEEAASVAASSPADSRTGVPASLMHDPTHDDLLPRSGGLGAARRLRLRK